MFPRSNVARGAIPALLLCAFLASASGADEAPVSSSPKAAVEAARAGFVDTLFWAPEILVEAERIGPEEKIMSRSGFVAVMDLSLRRHIVEDAASFLSRSVGVRIRRQGGIGSYSTMSIRGSSSSQVQVYLDGVPLNDPYSGVTDLGDISTSDLERVEIYRGTSPTGFGGSSIGGTVNLVSRDAGNEGLYGEAFGSAGSFGTRRFTAALRGKAGPFSLRVSGGYLETLGDFSFIDDNGTPLNDADDEETTRLNSDFTRWNGAARLGASPKAFDEISVSFSGVLREGGIPGIGSNQSSSARYERDRRITYLKLRPTPLAGRMVHLDATVFHSWTADRFDDPDGSIGLVRQSTDNRIISNGGNLRSRVFLPPLRLSIETFLEGRDEKFKPRDMLPEPSDGPERKRRSATASVSAEADLIGEKAFISGALRYEWSRSEYWDEPLFPWLPPVPEGPVQTDETTPSAGFRAYPLAWLAVKANWGKHYRLPTFFEMFGDLGTVTGAPDLGPERGTNRDIGIILSGRRFWIFDSPRLEAVYTDNELEGLILFFQNSQYTVRPRNIGSARVRGFEFSAAATAAGRLRLSGNYTRLDSRDTGPVPYYNGNLLPGRPEHEISIGSELLLRRWSLMYELHYLGDNYLDRANLIQEESRKIHDLTLTLRSLSYGMTLSIGGRNLGNERVYDVIGFPLPGRSFFASIGYTN